MAQAAKDKIGSHVGPGPASTVEMSALVSLHPLPTVMSPVLRSCWRMPASTASDQRR
jgi:hypothetical protein